MRCSHAVLDEQTIQVADIYQGSDPAIRCHRTNPAEDSTLEIGRRSWSSVQEDSREPGCGRENLQALHDQRSASHNLERVANLGQNAHADGRACGQVRVGL